MYKILWALLPSYSLKRFLHRNCVKSHLHKDLLSCLCIFFFSLRCQKQLIYRHFGYFSTSLSWLRTTVCSVPWLRVFTTHRPNPTALSHDSAPPNFFYTDVDLLPLPPVLQTQRQNNISTTNTVYTSKIIKIKKIKFNWTDALSVLDMFSFIDEDSRFCRHFIMAWFK